MSAVVGCDLSSHALDLVKLEEESNEAEWVRCTLEGKTAWDRTLGIREALWEATGDSFHRWLEDVYLVAIEAPYGRGQPGTNAILNRVVGAVASSLPARLRVPERCWLVRPDEWKGGLGLKGKPSGEDLHALGWRGFDIPGTKVPTYDQNALDAFALAFWARRENARGTAAA